MNIRTCRICGCTGQFACTTIGENCHWVANNLCSACAPEATLRQAAFLAASQASKAVPELLAFAENGGDLSDDCGIEVLLQLADALRLAIDATGTELSEELGQVYAAAQRLTEGWVG